MQFRVYRVSGDAYARVVFEGCSAFIVPLYQAVRADGRRVLRGMEQMAGWSLTLEYADDDSGPASPEEDQGDRPTVSMSCGSLRSHPDERERAAT